MSTLLPLMTGITDQQISKLNEELNQDLVKKNQYDKFGDGTYLDIDTYRRIMNDVFGFTWSWEILDVMEKDTFVLVKGRLSVPGVGVKEGFGVGKLDKKDNSTAFSAAASYAFKNCCRMVGVAATILDDNFFEPLYEVEAAPPKKENKKPASKVEEPEEKPQKKPARDEEDEPEQAPRKKQAEPEESRDEKPAKKGSSDEWTEERVKKVNDLKGTYNIVSKDQMVAFAQIWNPKIKAISDLTPNVFMELYDYVEENSEEFEDYDPSEVA